MIGWVLRVCGPSSCELRRVAVEMWVYLLWFSLLQAYIVIFCLADIFGKTLSLVHAQFRGESVHFAPLFFNINTSSLKG